MAHTSRRAFKGAWPLADVAVVGVCRFAVAATGFGRARFGRACFGAAGCACAAATAARGAAGFLRFAAIGLAGLPASAGDGFAAALAVGAGVLAATAGDSATSGVIGVVAEAVVAVASGFAVLCGGFVVAITMLPGSMFVLRCKMLMVLRFMSL